jgi:hypothetical protein
VDLPLSPLATSLVVAAVALVLVAIAFGVARIWWPTPIARRVASAFVGGAGLCAIGALAAIVRSIGVTESNGDTYGVFTRWSLVEIAAAAVGGGLLLAWLALRRSR